MLWDPGSQIQIKKEIFEFNISNCKTYSFQISFWHVAFPLIIPQIIIVGLKLAQMLWNIEFT